MQVNSSVTLDQQGKALRKKKNQPWSRKKKVLQKSKQNSDLRTWEMQEIQEMQQICSLVIKLGINCIAKNSKLF